MYAQQSVVLFTLCKKFVAKMTIMCEIKAEYLAFHYIRRDSFRHFRYQRQVTFCVTIRNKQQWTKVPLLNNSSKTLKALRIFLSLLPTYWTTLDLNVKYFYKCHLRVGLRHYWAHFSPLRKPAKSSVECQPWCKVLYTMFLARYQLNHTAQHLVNHKQGNLCTIEIL